MKLRSYLITILSFVALSCIDKGEIADWLPNQQLWKSLNIHNYSMVQRLDCFCAGGGRNVRVEVRADTVFSVTAIDTLPWPIQLESYFTIESLFLQIQQAHAVPGAYFRATYNPEYGYPEYFYFDRIPGAVDDEIAIRTSNLTAQ